MNTEEGFILASLKEFVKIWGSGNQATFNLECRNSQVLVKFETHLGHPAHQHFVPHPPQGQDHQHGSHASEVHHQPRHRGPGQIRRDQARAAAHRARQDQQLTGSVTASTQTSELSEETVEVSIIEPPHTPAASAPSTPLVAPQTPQAETSQSGASSDTPTLTEAASALPLSEQVLATDLTEAATAIESDASKEALEKSDITVVHTTAIFEDSPFETLLKEDYSSLQKFILSEEHLVKNICQLESQHCSSRELRSCSLKHTLEIKIHVKCSNLWEHARAYIWKHLGQGDYKRSNGTRIHLVKIHVK